MHLPTRLTLLLSTAMLSGAFAQTAPRPADTPKAAGVDAPEGQSVVVTAQKRLQIAQDVPLAVSVVGSDYIAKSGAVSLKDVVSAIPSLQFTQSQSAVQSSVTIRGVGSSGGVAGLEPSVGMYVDGVYLDRTYMGLGDFNDIERIEVLRGPQGTLFGKNTPAGVISFVTKRPSFTPSGAVEATMGTFGLKKVAATFTGPVVSDQLALRVSAFDSNRDGLFENTYTGAKVNDSRSGGVRARALLRATNDVDLLFSLEHTNQRGLCCAAETGPVPDSRLASAAAAGRPFPSVMNPTDRKVSFDGVFSNKVSVDAAGVEANWTLGDYTLTGIFSVRDTVQFGGIDADFSQLAFLNILAGRDSGQKSLELRIASPADRLFNYVAGLYYLSTAVTENSTTTGLINNKGFSQIDNKSWAAFGQATYAFTKQFDISAGLRYTHDKKSLFASQTPGWGSAAESGSDGKFSGMTNARYRWDKDSMVYASLTRGYKSFGFNDGQINPALGQKRFFDAELSTSTEIGVKKEWMNRRFTTNATLFNTVFDNYQASSFSPNPSGGGSVFLLQNAAKLTTRGLELELSARPNPNTELSLAYTYLNAKFDNFKTGPGITGVSTVQDLSGRTLANAPKNAFSVVGSQRWPIAGTGMTLFAWGEVSRRSDYFTGQNLDPQFAQPAYTLVNARAGIESGAWTLEAWVRNATDKTVLYAGAFNPLGATMPKLYFIGDPRTAGATLRVKF